MAIHDIWLENLTALVRTEGKGRRNRDGLRAVADLVGASEEYIYQLVERKPKKDGTLRQIGKELAKKIDAAYAPEKGAGWFDRPINEASFTKIASFSSQPSSIVSEIPIKNLSQAIEVLGKALLSSPDWGTDKLAGTFSDWVKDSTNERKKKSVLDLFVVTTDIASQANDTKAA